ncbi:winged helix-turn-helix domain-containing protein [Streptomyces sp. NPDC018000]|uniref:winged helix-turn-helix domain-containing protein n=1 Tax=Streptomyces sp. NPDC018000 TaxID=3365028 RepID=UPI0037BD1531
MQWLPFTPPKSDGDFSCPPTSSAARVPGHCSTRSARPFSYTRPYGILQSDGLVAAPPATRPRSSRALATLLGRTRAAVLEVLASPDGHTTKQLAQGLAISPASASEHVTSLRDAGLVTSLRQANTVRHTTTALGNNLISTANGDPGQSLRVRDTA